MEDLTLASQDWMLCKFPIPYLYELPKRELSFSCYVPFSFV
jgi:hypothetical protein